MSGMKIAAIVVIVVLGVALAGTLSWGIWEARRMYIGKKRRAAAHQLLHHKAKLGGIATGPGPVLPPGATTGANAPTPDATSDLGQGGCMNENMVGAPFPSESLRGSTASCGFSRSAPMGSKPVPLATSHISRSKLGKNTRVDLSQYASMSGDQAIAAQGLDSPVDLALASALTGSSIVNGSTRLVCTDPRGEPSSGWQVEYSKSSLDGKWSLGYGGVTPTDGPYALSSRSRNPGY